MHSFICKELLSLRNISLYSLMTYRLNMELKHLSAHFEAVKKFTRLQHLAYSLEFVV